MDDKDGTNVDGDIIGDANTVLSTSNYKKPIIKKVSFDMTTFKKENEVNETLFGDALNTIQHDKDPPPDAGSAHSYTNIACPSTDILNNRTTKTSTLGALESRSSFIDEKSSIVIDGSDIILPPPPSFESPDDKYLSVLLNAPIQIVPPPPKPESKIDIRPPLPPVDFDESDIAPPPPVNFATLPSRSSLYSDDLGNISPRVNILPKKQDIDEVFIPPNAKNTFLDKNDSNDCNPSPELIQVHISTLPTLYHLSDVQRTIVPAMPISPNRMSSNYELGSSSKFNFPNITHSASFPLSNDPIMPLSTVSGGFNPYIITNSPAKSESNTKTLPVENNISSVETPSSKESFKNEKKVHFGTVSPTPYKHSLYTQAILQPNEPIVNKVQYSKYTNTSHTLHGIETSGGEVDFSVKKFGKVGLVVVNTYYLFAISFILLILTVDYV